MPVGTLTNMTATGDLITSPGAPTTLVKGMPVSCLGDMVAGAMCTTGAVTMTMAVTKLAKGRPMACMTSMVVGIGPPPLCLPVTTTVMSTNANNIV
ncbi:MAG: hypothetical protein LBB77_08960 [Treponema sp.]|nr:hypothetical protein [Treponema sp.]